MNVTARPQPSRVILVGPPGSGKGTQADAIGGTHISTGEILREEVKLGTDLGKQAEVFMKQGLLVPDELILGMVKGRVAKEESFVLDGFPRSTPQAEGLDRMLTELGRPLTAVTLLDVDDEVIVARLKERGREDDKEEVIRERLKVYHSQTEPMLAHFRKQGLVESIPAEGSVSEVQALVADRLADRQAGVAPVLGTPLPAAYIHDAPGLKAGDLLGAIDGHVASGNAPYPAAWDKAAVTESTKAFLSQYPEATLPALAGAAKAFTEDELAGVKTCARNQVIGGLVGGLGAATFVTGGLMNQGFLAGLGAAVMVGGVAANVYSQFAMEEHRTNLQGLEGTRDLLESWQARLSG